jgi:arylsulfatase A-like enzyme
MKTTRRTALKSLMAGAATTPLSRAFSFGLTANPSGSGRRLNILFIMVDQLHHRALSGLGNQEVRTPNIDRLIKSGTVFETCYCSSPVCMPCRSTMLTGRMPSETGVWINTAHQKSRGRVERDIPTIGAWLKSQGGYETIYAGKYHVPQCHTYSIPGFEVINAGLEHRGEPGDAGTARASESWLYNYASDQSAPFFMICSLVNPHDVCQWLSLNTTHDPDRLERYPHIEQVAKQPDLPANFPVAVLSESSTQINIRTKQQPTAGGWQENDWRYYMWAYYRQVEMVDAQIGRVLDALEETGLDKNTLVVFTSDHGEGLGEHQMVRKGYLYDSATRVPLIFSMPGTVPSGKINTESMTGIIDLVPTFCDFAGVPIPPGLNHAQSLCPVLIGEQKAPFRPMVVTENNDPARNRPTAAAAGRQLRTGKYKYITYFDQSVEQLFDMENDPGETVNLALSDTYQAVLESHREMLREWERKIITSPNVPESPWKGALLK